MAAHHFSDHENNKAKQRAYWSRNRERGHAMQKQWRIENAEKKRAADKTWQAENPGKVRQYHVVSQARRRSAVGSFSATDIDGLFKSQRGKCAICRAKLAEGYHVDHITPISKGGTHFKRNLQLLCPPCNLRKHAHDPIDYMRSIGRLL